MPKYTIKLNAIIMGKDTLEIDVPNDYQVGQSIFISPAANITITNSNGGKDSLGRSASISGIVVSKD